MLFDKQRTYLNKSDLFEIRILPLFYLFLSYKLQKFFL